MGLKTARGRFGGLRSANIAWLHPRISARARILSRTSAQPPQSRPELSGGPESLTPVAGTLASVQSPTEPNAERRVHTPEATQIAQIRRSATDRANKPTGAQSGGSGAQAGCRWRSRSVTGLRNWCRDDRALGSRHAGSRSGTRPRELGPFLARHDKTATRHARLAEVRASRRRAWLYAACWRPGRPQGG